MVADAPVPAGPDPGGTVWQVPQTAVRAVCLFVHGRGQSPEEMQTHVLSRLRVPGRAFALPRAPGGAWYDATAVDPLCDATRTQLTVALDGIAAGMAQLRTRHPGLPRSCWRGSRKGRAWRRNTCARGGPRPRRWRR